ncbi:MAG: hypothetical protein R2762_28295 [Bryobacteraceae bacterium]
MNRQSWKLRMTAAVAALAVFMAACGGAAAQEARDAAAESAAFARLLEQQRMQRERQLQTDRVRLLAQVEAAKREAAIRAWQNPLAFAALVVGGYSVATRLSSTLTQSQRDTLDGLIVLAAAYLLFNFEECNNLLRDLTAIESRRQRAQSEADAVSAELLRLQAAR